MAWAAIALSCVALLVRVPSVATVAVTASAGAVGLIAPAPAPQRRRWLRVAAVGVCAFAAARVLAGSLIAPRATLGAALGTSIAAVAEEALFRRLVYGRLVRFGAAAAVAGSAVLFAAVHVPAYGVAVFPLDLAAGLVLGWQRWASGTWTAPALTHVTANLLQLR
jgi:membrane protease YdiL (CAAX protease family)